MGTISGASAFMSDNLQKAAFGAGNIFIKDTVNTIANLQQAAGKMNALNRDKLMEMMGSGAYYKIESAGVLKESDYNIAFVGIYNPDALRAVNYWHQYGAIGWSEYNEDEIAKMVKSFTAVLEADENKEMDDEERKIIELSINMLEGGTIFSDESNDMERINNAIIKIDKKGIEIKNKEAEGEEAQIENIEGTNEEEGQIENIGRMEGEEEKMETDLKTQFKEFICYKQGTDGKSMQTFQEENE
ncbi:hypothetical protein AALA79_21620 [Lachnospiraceae bacterium 64-25]